MTRRNERIAFLGLLALGLAGHVSVVKWFGFTGMVVLLGVGALLFAAGMRGVGA